MSADESIRYFSNGTEGSIWMAEWCNRCLHDPCDNGPDDPGEPLKPTPDPNQGVLFETSELMPGVWRDVGLDTFGVPVDTGVEP